MAASNGPQFRSWLLSKERSTIALWPTLMGMFHAIHLLTVTDNHTTFFRGICRTCLLISLALFYFASYGHHPEKIRWLFFTFGLVQSCAFALCMWWAHAGNVCPPVHYYADPITNLYTVVPQLIAIDLPVVPHCLFRLIHMAASVLLYVHMVGHSWVLAVLRAAFIHGVVCTLGYEYVSRKLVRSFRSHQQHKESSAPNSNEKLLRVEGKTATNSVTEVVEGVHSSTNAPAASDSSGLEAFPTHVYCSKMVRRKVTVMVQTLTLVNQLSDFQRQDLMQSLCKASNCLVADIALRAGCLVISFNVLETEDASLTKEGKDLGLEQALSTKFSDAVTSWVGKHDLKLRDRVDALDVVAKVSSYSAPVDSHDTAPNEPSEVPQLMPRQSQLGAISLPSPAILMPVPEQHAQQHASVSFTVMLNGGLGLSTLHGWEDHQQDSPEEDVPGTLRLLCCLPSSYIPIRIVEQAPGESGQTTKLQVTASVPASVVQSAAGSPLCLELWQSGALICCHNTLLLSNSLAPVLVELQAWAASGKQQQKQGQVGQAAAEGSDMGVTDFVADLADWMHFAEAKQQQSTASEGAQMMSKKQEEDVQSMAACGMDLLYSAVRGGMVALSGVLITRLMSAPFSCSFPSLALKQNKAPVDMPQASHRPGSGRLLLTNALLSGSVRMLQQVLKWAQSLGGPAFAWPWEASDCSKEGLLRAIQTKSTQGAQLVQLLEASNNTAAVSVEQQSAAAPAAVQRGADEGADRRRPTYSDWFMVTYAPHFIRWSQILGLGLLISVFHVDSHPVTIPTIIFMLISAIAVGLSAQARATKWVQRSFSIYVMAAFVLLFQMSSVGKAPNLHLYLDILTCNATYVPLWLILDFCVVQLACFVVAYFGVAIYFYTSVNGHSLALAIVRAGIVHSACLITYMASRRACKKAFTQEVGKQKVA